MALWIIEINDSLSGLTIALHDLPGHLREVEAGGRLSVAGWFTA